MRKSKSTPRTRLGRRVGCVVGAAALAAVSLATPAYAEAKLTLSQSSGPSGGLNTILATSPTAVFTSVTPPVALFVTTGAAGTTLCPATYAIPVAIATNAAGAQTAGIVGVPNANVRKVSNSKVAIAVPGTALAPGGPDPSDAVNAAGLALLTAGPNPAQTMAKYNVCLYANRTINTTTNPLLASGVYSIASAPTITSITPSSGPALGGAKVTVEGTGFTTGMTASVGNSPLTNITVGAGGTSFTATTPPRAAVNDLSVSVTATGGTVTSTPTGGAGGIDFSYVNGITVTPNTNAGAALTTLDIIGVGFNDLTFANGTDTLAASGHVFFTEGAYNPARPGATTGDDDRTNAPVSECVNVLKIGDTEIICDFDRTVTVNPTTGAHAVGTVGEGAYVVSVVSTGAEAASGHFQTRVTSGSIFTVAEY